MFQEVAMLQSQLEAKQRLTENLKYFNRHIGILQEEILTLKSQLYVKQKKSEDVKVFANLQEECPGLKLQLQNQAKCLEESKELNKLKDEYSKLGTKLRVRQNIMKKAEEMKVHTKILQEENFELKAQLELAQKQLGNSEVENQQYVKQLSELKDKERCDIAIQTNTVCRLLLKI